MKIIQDNKTIFHMVGVFSKSADNLPAKLNYLVSCQLEAF